MCVSCTVLADTPTGTRLTLVLFSALSRRIKQSFQMGFRALNNEEFEGLCVDFKMGLDLVVNSKVT